MSTSHESLYLGKESFVQWKVVDVPTSFILNIIFFDKAFEYAGGGNFVVMFGQTLNHFV
jgi:hypothetical protein